MLLENVCMFVCFVFFAMTGCHASIMISLNINKVDCRIFSSLDLWCFGGKIPKDSFVSLIIFTRNSRFYVNDL